MSQVPGQQSLEIERKYEVAADLPLPSAATLLDAGFVAAPPVTYALSAIYFDTPGADLATRGLAVRARTGGSDAGWHLKERGADGVRELFWPLEAELPEGLREELRTRIGDAVEALAPIAELQTERTVVVLSDAQGAALIELADDRVDALDRLGDVARRWREWEAELLPAGSPATLDAVEPLLLAAGAEPSLSSAKIARATGRLVAAAEAAGAGEERIALLRALDEADRAAADAPQPENGVSA